MLLGHNRGGREWIELDRFGIILERIIIQDLHFGRFTLTPDGRLFAQHYSDRTSGGPVVTFDSAGKPKTIMKSDAILAGADGGKLVFLSLNSGKEASLRWVDMPPG